MGMGQYRTLSILILLLTQSVFSGEPLVLVDARDSYRVGPYLEILEDPSGERTISDFLGSEIGFRFTRNRKGILNFGFTRSTYWLRFTLRNEAADRSVWTLSIDNANLDYIDFYVLNPGDRDITVQKSGRMRRHPENAHSSTHPLFLIPIPQFESREIYIRIRSDAAMVVPATIRSRTAFLNHLQSEHLVAGFLLGILVIMFCYNLFIFLSLRDRNYLYFVIYILAVLGFFISTRGIGYRYLWSDLITWNRLAIPVFAGLLVMAMLKFTDSFLMAREKMPLLHKMMNALLVLMALSVALSVLINYQTALRLLVIGGILGSALIQIVVIRSLLRGFRPARYLMLGYVLLSLGGISYLLVRMGYLASNPWTEESFTWGNVMIILLMALALADRIKILKKEKEQTDLELKQSEEQLRILSRATEQSPALIIITDLSGAIEYVNPRFSQVTGYSLEEVRGENPRILKSGETPARVYRELWAAITSGKEWKGEFHNRKKNGDLYWESVFICPITNDAGETTHYLGLKEDITERKQLHDQLIQAQKMESIGTLAGGIAHDFNNILTVIKGHADIALSKLSDLHPALKDLKVIHASGEKAENLTRQILAFSRKQIYQPQIVDINRIIGGMENMIQRLIGEDIIIEMIMPASIPSIKADPSQIEQVFINLIINARDAIELKKGSETKKIIIETGVTVLDRDYANTHVGVREGPHVFISVSDSGVGMNQEIRRQVFDPFFTTKSEGTGLGLATVYGIVKQNNAHIFMYSEPGRGSTFKIYWPTTGDRIDPVWVQDAGFGDTRGSEQIILAEDDPDVADFACTVLRKAGYTVCAAGNGQQALEWLNENELPPDLLVTDLIMPDMNGKELAEKMRVLIPDLRVLFASGYTDNHLIHRGELDEGVNFLQKPYSVAQLLRKVRDVLEA